MRRIDDSTSWIWPFRAAAPSNSHELSGLELPLVAIDVRHQLGDDLGRCVAVRGTGTRRRCGRSYFLVAPRVAPARIFNGQAESVGSLFGAKCNVIVPLMTPCR